MREETSLHAFTPPTSQVPPGSLEQLIAGIDQSLTRHDALPTTVTPLAPAPGSAPSTQGKYIVFSLADSQYAVPLNQVIEVGETQPITPVPNVPDWVLGIINLRGDIISVVDCGAFLQVHNRGVVEMSSFCVVRNQKRDLITSLLVDRIEGMLNLAGDVTPLPTEQLTDQLVPYLQGVYEHQGQLLKILNLEGLLSSLTLTA